MEKEGERQEGSSISAGAAVGWMHGRATIPGRRWETGVISEFQYHSLKDVLASGLNILCPALYKHHKVKKETRQLTYLAMTFYKLLHFQGTHEYQCFICTKRSLSKRNHCWLVIRSGLWKYCNMAHGEHFTWGKWVLIVPKKGNNGRVSYYRG